jgi:hypothetical protein
MGILDEAQPFARLRDKEGFVVASFAKKAILQDEVIARLSDKLLVLLV